MVLTASISGWGAVAMPRLRSWPERFGAGTLLVFFLMAAAGWSGFLSSAVLWTVLSLGMLLWARPGGFSVSRGFLLAGICGLFMLPLVMLPPLSRDGMIHHLYQARLWLEAGRIVRPQWCGFFSYPYLTESLYTLAGGTFGFRVSRAVSFIGFLASCSVLTGYFLKRGRKRAAVLSLLVLLSIPELYRNATWSYSDSFLVFFGLLTYVEMLREKSNPVLVLVWAGAAACCKYNGFLVMVSVLILMPFRFRRLSRKTLIAAGAAGTFMVAWWALPNLLQWGNPVYPLLRSVFGPVEEAGTGASDYFAGSAFRTSLHTVKDYILLPVRISLHGRWDDPALFDGSSGPLLLAGSIMALPLLKDKRRKFLLPLLYMLFTVAAKGSALRVRYLLPGLAMLALPVTEAVTALLRKKGAVRYAAIVLTAGCLAWSAEKVSGLYLLERPWNYRGEGAYLSARTGYYDFYKGCEDFVASGDTTYLVNLSRPFYFPGYAVFDGNGLPISFVDLLWRGCGSEAISDSMRVRGIDFIAADMFLTSINVAPELDEDQLLQWKDFVCRWLEPRMTMG
ncbi:MAG: hypothetical protein GF388_01555, partial [Candidatus Aegiribacteria sp.]|nr:hypothetical protein [Candidatus Aegiribacteria sp.]MBD3294060.1 hypothetical protein [Candidatus Fermentibacteria bacterium]